MLLGHAGLFRLAPDLEVAVLEPRACLGRKEVRHVEHARELRPARRGKAELETIELGFELAEQRGLVRLCVCEEEEGQEDAEQRSADEEKAPALLKRYWRRLATSKAAEERLGQGDLVVRRSGLLDVIAPGNIGRMSFTQEVHCIVEQGALGAGYWVIQRK